MTDLQKVKALLKENPELVSGKDNYGLTPLQLAGAKGHKEVAELLLVKEADINARDNDGKTPMKLTVEKGKTDVAELLRQHGE
jgi:ankyrin repeat protein